MPRLRVVPKVAWKIYIPRDLSLKIDLLILNPLTGRTEYGARSEYIERLVREDLSRRINAKSAEMEQPS